MFFANNLIHRGNVLQAEFGLSGPNEDGYYDWNGHLEDTKSSPEYIVGGSTKVQLKICGHQVEDESYYIGFIMIRFSKKRQVDEMDYTIKISSKKLKLNDQMLTTDERWRVIYENERHSTKPRAFDMSLEVNLVTTASSYASLYEDTELTDFELRGEDGFVRIHKFPLICSSPVLRGMLSGTWKETAKGAVDVPGMSRLTLQHLKDYMYLGSLPDTGLRDLLLLAVYYMMPDLERRCTFVLVNDMNEENGGELLEFGVKYKLRMLLSTILEYVQNGLVKIDDIANYYGHAM